MKELFKVLLGLAAFAGGVIVVQIVLIALAFRSNYDTDYIRLEENLPGQYYIRGVNPGWPKGDDVDYAYLLYYKDDDSQEYEKVGHTGGLRYSEVSSSKIEGNYLRIYELGDRRYQNENVITCYNAREEKLASAHNCLK